MIAKMTHIGKWLQGQLSQYQNQLQKLGLTLGIMASFLWAVALPTPFPNVDVPLFASCVPTELPPTVRPSPTPTTASPRPKPKPTPAPTPKSKPKR